MTVYRYVRTGRLAASRDGTAWVVTPDELDQFRNATATADPSTTQSPRKDGGSPPRGDGMWAQRLAATLASGDETAAWRIIEQALVSGHTPAECYLDIFGVALGEVSVGTPDFDTSTEFIATTTALRLAARLGGRFRRPGRTRGTVVFGAPVGEHHALPISIVADLVRMEGYACLELGANVPAQAFADAARHATRLVAVGIGVTTIASIDNLRNTIAAVRLVLPDVPVLLGGQAVTNPEIAGLHGATHWAPDARRAIDVISSLAGPSRSRTSSKRTSEPTRT